MSTVPFYIADSFTRTPYQGNPAGVVFPEAELSEAQMLAIAGELHLETVFAVRAERLAGQDYRVAYYTGTARVPLCGHDTIALVSVLAQTGQLTAPAALRLATDVGLLTVSAEEDGTVIMVQAPPRFGQVIHPAEAATALGLPPSEIEETHLPVQVVSTGNPFLIVPAAHRAAVSALAPDIAALIAYGDGLEEPITGIYVWTPETVEADALVHARCFCPAAGLPEDPVTGTASGAVGAYLFRHGRLTPGADGAASFRTEQGHAMGRPGSAGVRLETDSSVITRVQVSGTAILIGQGTLWIESGTTTRNLWKWGGGGRNNGLEKSVSSGNNSGRPLASTGIGCPAGKRAILRQSGYRDPKSASNGGGACEERRNLVMNRSRGVLSVTSFSARTAAMTAADKKVSQDNVKLCALCGTLNHGDNVECWTCRWHGGFDHDAHLIALAWQRLESQYEEVRLEHVTSRKLRMLGDFGAPRPRARWQTWAEDCRAVWTNFLAQRDLRMAKRRASLRSQSSRSSGLGV